MAQDFGGLVGMAVQVKGDKELRRKLEHIQGPAATKALYAGVRAGMTPVARALRSAVNASSAPQAVKAAARKTVSQRFAKAGRKREMAAKVGFGVGKRSKAGSERSAPGVGISKSNIHWFVLGTAQRELKSGHPTGQIKPYLAGLTHGALSATSGDALAKARAKIADVIAKEAAKQR